MSRFTIQRTASSTLLLTALLSGCASGPNPALERAQAAYNQASQDAQTDLPP